MSDNVALLRGYTRELMAFDYLGEARHFMVQPDAELDLYISAWDCDAQEFIRIKAGLYTFEDIEPGDQEVPTSDELAGFEVA